MDATVTIAQEAGACFGVERALKMALEASEGEAPVFTLGPLIHNPVVVADLERRGVMVTNTPVVEKGATILLRTHGVTPEVERAARDAGATVLDATCPFVKRVHKNIERLSEAGYDVLIVGEKGHPEVEGTLGHSPEARVVGSADEVGTLELGNRVGIVVQTTQTEENLRSIVSALIGRVEELRVLDTICEATSTRQAAARELSSRVDVMIVIGGKNSANTTHLAEICAESCEKTYHIETACELDETWFGTVCHIGITAGASTPQSQIEEVYQAIKALLAKRQVAR